MKWYNDRTLLTNFSTALIDAGVLEDTDDVKAFFARPYKYDDYFDAWREAGHPSEDDDNWDEFVASIESENEDVDDDSDEDEDEDTEDEDE